METEIAVRFLNHFGGGFAEKILIQKGTTLGEFLASKLSGENVSSYKIRLNREPADPKEVLKEGDLIVLVPLKQEGAA